MAKLTVSDYTYSVLGLFPSSAKLPGFSDYHLLERRNFTVRGTGYVMEYMDPEY